MRKFHCILLMFFTLTCFSGLPKKEYEDLELFAHVLNMIRQNFVGNIEHRKLIYGAISGMLEELDPHSHHYPPEAYREMKQDTSGAFGGIGIEITTRDKELTIVAPIEGSPAHRAGIEPGDKIVKIGENFTKDLSMYECIKLLKGKIRTMVTISVKRKDRKDLLKFTLQRQRIREKSVTMKNLGDGIACFRISQFQERTASDFKKLFHRFQKESKTINGVILDLRINPGGILNQAAEIVDMFIDKGEIVHIEMRNPEEKKFFKATAPNTFMGFPMAVIVDEGSASASEIVAGALQDHKRAAVIGTKTFGKGTVQNVIDLPDGSGLKLTVANYYTPKGRSFQDLGITPDIVVKKESVDSRTTSTNPSKKVKKSASVDQGKGKVTESKKQSEIQKLLKDDNQLDSALTYIKSFRGLKEVSKK